MPSTHTAGVEHSRKTAGYPSDLTDQKWALITPYLPAAKKNGCPRKTDLHAVMNTIL